MTEQEWLECTDPHSSLRHIKLQCRLQIPRRKLRLLLCACCRFVWKLTSSFDQRHVIDLIEQFADGLVSNDEMNATRHVIYKDHDSYPYVRWSPSLLAIRLAASANSLLWDAAHQATKLLFEARMNAA